MRIPVAMRVGVLLPLALLLASCGDEPAPAVDDGLVWHVTMDAASARQRAQVHGGWGELRRNTWPEARHARVDRLEDDPVVPLFVVNVFSDGVAHFKGDTYTLRDPERPHRNDFGGLREAWETMTANPEWRDADGNSLIPLMLGVHREAPWDHVPSLVRQAFADTVRIRRIQWAVRMYGARQRYRHEARVTRIEGTDPWAPRVGLSGKSVDGNEVVTLRLRRGERRWQFHRAWSDYYDPVLVAKANSIWSEFKDALGDWGTAEVPIVLDLPVPAPGVTWGHVVTVFDLLLGAGWRVVDLRVQGWRLTFPDPSEEAR